MTTTKKSCQIQLSELDPELTSGSAMSFVFVFLRNINQIRSSVNLDVGPRRRPSWDDDDDDDTDVIDGETETLATSCCSFFFIFSLFFFVCWGGGFQKTKRLPPEEEEEESRWKVAATSTPPRPKTPKKNNKRRQFCSNRFEPMRRPFLYFYFFFIPFFFCLSGYCPRSRPGGSSINRFFFALKRRRSRSEELVELVELDEKKPEKETKTKKKPVDGLVVFDRQGVVVPERSRVVPKYSPSPGHRSRPTISKCERHRDIAGLYRVFFCSLGPTIDQVRSCGSISSTTGLRRTGPPERNNKKNIETKKKENRRTKKKERPVTGTGRPLRKKTHWSLCGAAS